MIWLLYQFSVGSDTASHRPCSCTVMSLRQGVWHDFSVSHLRVEIECSGKCIVINPTDSKPQRWDFYQICGWVCPKNFDSWKDRYAFWVVQGLSTSPTLWGIRIAAEAPRVRTNPRWESCNAVTVCALRWFTFSNLSNHPIWRAAQSFIDDFEGCTTRGYIWVHNLHHSPSISNDLFVAHDYLVYLFARHTLRLGCNDWWPDQTWHGKMRFGG